MQLINWKVKLKLKGENYCLLSTAGADNVDAKSNNIIFTIKDAKLYVPDITLLLKDNQRLSKLLAKDLKYRCIGTNIKQKFRIKMQQTSIDIFSNQTL